MYFQQEDKEDEEVRIAKKRERDQEIKLLLEQVLGKDYDKKKKKDNEREA